MAAHGIATEKPRRARRWTFGKGLKAWLEVLPFLAPGLILFLVFSLWPMVQGVRISFYKWSIMPGAHQTWVGLANYSRAFHDKIVGLSIQNTLLYTVITVPGQMAVGMLAALALNQKLKFRSGWRAIYYIPTLTSWVIVSYLFMYLFNGGGSPINYIFKDVLHVMPNYVDWLQDRWTAQVPINVLGIWKGIGWTMVMFLAGLQSVPKELMEAAAIDGASASKTFWKITLPLLKPVVLFVLVLLTMGGFNVFLSVQLLTGGGPLNSTQVMLNYMYDQGFSYFDFGYGFALAAMMGLVMFIISFFQFRFVNGKMDT